MFTEQERYQKAKQITLLGAVVNFILAVIKIVFGILGHSSALFADGIHSFSDLLTDGLVLLAARFASKGADEDHPYGHARIETAATVGLAVFLLLAGIGIIWDAINHIFWQIPDIPKAYALVVAFFSIVANEILFHVTQKVAKQTLSNLLYANAWHHRSDAASSLVVLIGIAGALLGFIYLDTIAAIIVGLMIIKMAIVLTYRSTRELVDTGVEPKTLQQIEKVIINIPGVKAIHQLRTRKMAENILIDVHVLVDHDLTVSEGHYIASKVHATLMSEVENVSDVTVHIDPENDEVADLNDSLPARRQVLREFKMAVKDLPGADKVEHIALHYLRGKIRIDCYLPLAILKTNQDEIKLADEYNKQIKKIDYVDSIELFFK